MISLFYSDVHFFSFQLTSHSFNVAWHFLLVPVRFHLCFGWSRTPVSVAAISILLFLLLRLSNLTYAFSTHIINIIVWLSYTFFHHTSEPIEILGRALHGTLETCGKKKSSSFIGFYFLFFLEQQHQSSPLSRLVSFPLPRSFVYRVRCHERR